jgi:hypothetical protein
LKGDIPLLFLTGMQPAQPDYVALAMVLVLFAVVLIMVIRKYLANKRNAAAPVKVETVPEDPKPSAPQAEAIGTAGQLKLHDVDPKSAAMIMAIVADKLDKPLNQLRFLSIKEVK